MTSTVKAYYAALAAGKGATACSLLSAHIKQAIAHTIGQSSALLKGKGCAGSLALLFHHQPGQPGVVSSAVTVTGLRVNGDRGYALISTQAKPSEDMRVEHEHGAWKVDALIGRALG